MAILDGVPMTEAEMTRALEMAGRVVEGALAEMELDERQRSILDLMRQGLSPATILGITKEERDAMLVQGLRYLQVGKIGMARDVLLNLHKLESLDERVIYALGSTYQVEGDYETAGRIYLQALALDAANPDGHLRLGECFLGNREVEKARDCFVTAGDLASRGHGRPGTAPYAERMLALAEARLKAA